MKVLPEALVSIIVTLVSAAAAAGSFWVAIRRYRREIPSKGLAYFSSSDDHSVRIQVWNSGNTPIAEEDYLNSIGFDFGSDAQIRKVIVEEQIPQDLGVNFGDRRASNSRYLDIPQIYLNPEDRFALQVFLTGAGGQKTPTPYGRIRGTHQLFKEVRAPRRVGETERVSFRTYVIFGLVVLFTIAAVIAWVRAIATIPTPTQFEEYQSRRGSTVFAFNVPGEMQLGDTARANVTISGDLVNDLETAVLEQALQGPDMADKSPSSLVKASLTSGPSVTVTQLSPAVQASSPDVPTEWEWDIRPTSSGTHALHLTVSAVLSVDGEQRTLVLQSFDRTIVVNASPSQRIWSILIVVIVITTIIAALGRWLWEKRKNRNQ